MSRNGLNGRPPGDDRSGADDGRSILEERNDVHECQLCEAAWKNQGAVWQPR